MTQTPGCPKVRGTNRFLYAVVIRSYSVLASQTLRNRHVRKGSL